MSRRTAQRRTRKRCRTLRGFVADGSEKVDALAKAGAMLDEGSWRKREQRQCSRSEKRCTQPLQYAASFHCLLEEWKDCAEVKPKAKRKVDFRGPEIEETKHRTEWCAEADSIDVRDVEEAAST